MDHDIGAAAQRVVEHYYGENGRLAYEAFAHINRKLFDDRLPTPLIVWELTAHGGCLGHTDPDHVVISLHPSLLGGTEKSNPWNIDPQHLGWRFAYDVLVHECIHVAVASLLGGSTGETSHNCDEWISEVNRIAPLLGLRGVVAARSKATRVPDPDAPASANGKPRTKVARRSNGSIPFRVVAGFPDAVRKHLGQTDYYLRRGLPWR